MSSSDGAGANNGIPSSLNSFPIGLGFDAFPDTTRASNCPFSSSRSLSLLWSLQRLVKQPILFQYLNFQLIIDRLIFVTFFKKNRKLLFGLIVFASIWTLVNYFHKKLGFFN
ncbi:hypothetical protein M9Y10_033649 [Tritrichomonas musculus]|uniref:Uncharacterized protein n=1 Tax=Tritrichomonas musculus TaxID=1915356 RepID=A0ABR2KCQ4_9EUKA